MRTARAQGPITSGMHCAILFVAPALMPYCNALDQLSVRAPHNRCMPRLTNAECNNTMRPWQPQPCLHVAQQPSQHTQLIEHSPRKIQFFTAIAPTELIHRM